MSQVVARQEQFAEQRINIVTISFAEQRYWAEAWLQETQSPFPLLIDPERRAYQAYGLQQSFWRSWSVSNLAYYANALRQGKKLIEKRGDTTQLGGDFLVDEAGKVCFAQLNRDPTKRPSVDYLLQKATSC